MCGIFALFNKFGEPFCFTSKYYKFIAKNFDKIKNRGPDNSQLLNFKSYCVGFHRLSINDITDNGNQPFMNQDKTNFLVCNGEIYNHKELEKKYNIQVKSKSDCEFLLELFTKFGVYETIDDLDGVFAIITKINNKIYLIRDRVGVRPLFYGETPYEFIFSSLPQSLEFPDCVVNEVKPSTIIEFSEKFKMTETFYYTFPNPVKRFIFTKQIVQNVRVLLEEAVRKRMMSDRPVGCLLSGGLDSSIIAAILSREYKKQNKTLKTFSIGFPDSTDLVFARKVAKYIGSEHNEYIIDYKDAIKNIKNVVKELGTYDITTVRASTPMWMLCKWISTNYDEKVLFSGEGSDELFSGYLYFHNAPNYEELEKESLYLMNNLYKYDVLRSDRCISSNGLELREPFLDKNLIQYYLSISGYFRKPKDGFEKWILRKAFEDMLPEEVVWRRKAAFSDAVSSSEKPWFKYIQEWTDVVFNQINIPESFKTTESYYYYTIFKNYFTKYSPVVNYWLPKWQKNKDLDPSATTLQIYKKEEH